MSQKGTTYKFEIEGQEISIETGKYHSWAIKKVRRNPGNAGLYSHEKMMNSVTITSLLENKTPL